MDRPTPFFQKRNNTRVVVRNRNSFTRTSTRTTHATTISAVSTEPPKNLRKTVRRKITRSPTSTTSAASTTKVEKTTTTTRLPSTTRTSTTTKIQTTTKIPTTTEIPSTTPPDYEKFSEEFSDDIASILPALTSAKPRKTSPTVVEETTRALKQVQQNNWDFEPKEEQKQSSFDKILEQQYKIKGIDISSEENYEDEKLIGVLGSQVCLLFISFL